MTGARAVLSLVLLATLALVPTQVLAQAEGGCPAGQTPQFVFGFANLKGEIGDPMGEPVTCEFADPNGTGDVHQRTTTGLAFWRKSTNTPTFTNGSEHWAQTPTGLVTWIGAAIDPPTAYPPIVVDEFTRGCTALAPELGDTCRCAIEALQQRYSIAEFVGFAQRYARDGALPDEVVTIVFECLG